MCSPRASGRRVSPARIRDRARSGDLGRQHCGELQSDRSIGAWPWIIGSSFVLTGVTGLLTRGPLESISYGGEPHARSVGVAPLPGGGAISLSGKF